MQLEDAGVEKVPIGHGLQLVSPLALWKKPASHDTQEIWPSSDEIFPGSQSLQPVALDWS